MLLTTTPTVEGGRIIRYHGVVTGEVILGANVFRDFFASIRDIVGGRAGSYESVLRDGRNTAFGEMMQEAQRLGANAIVGIDVDYETLGKSMLMVSVSGTAVSVEMAFPGQSAPPQQGYPSSTPWGRG
jgi:uncharacterized protein YbjQ (UPF0145 family)